ncbi:Enterobactin exporter EntS [Austwickia sp. TVS 96-490-7B]|uniref:MFS transporter n=1 Tax=Austwickia sp. TVS 96-490-7B TaxID=2830843 RepID=UPI001C594A7E|nr:MFS transporter [Austwickia sp. TVS 96-490-7B]MBW3086042.1 Enterobactin exporter EntS [Austwickia sp. TVS 96-490-7B]
MSGSQALAPLKDSRFAWFFVGRMISTAGSVMAPVALAFAVLDISDSPVALGQILAARSIPLVIFLLVGGVIADRLPRTHVLVVSHVLSAVTQGAAAWLVITGRADLWQLAVIEVANGTMTAFTMPAIQGLVPQVVDRRLMQQANALLAFSRSGLAVIGPAVAGLLVIWSGPGWALAFDALTWLVAGLCMAAISLPTHRGEGGSSMLGELRAGWDVMVSRRWLWVVVCSCGVLNAIHAGAWSALGPVVVKSDPHLGEQAWGLAVSAEAVGLLAFTVVMMRARVVHPLRVGMIAISALALPLMALAGPAPLPVLLATAFCAGAGVQVFMVSWQTTLHESIPEQFMSRVSAYDALGSFVAIPAGQLIIGPIAAGVGTTWTLIGSSVVFVLIVGMTLSVTQVRDLQRVVVEDAGFQDRSEHSPDAQSTSAPSPMPAASLPSAAPVAGHRRRAAHRVAVPGRRHRDEADTTG